ncbi:hypothetical protein [Candidatus Amarobacter glycogenicus]|uniref:hypothetical protein n=1 Tax=Candidatus Amarobacter glycogenicus TaxID=3140699 RepID=UPI003135431C|nr:hypothetical protein [Dehalococcoidia bacterium]
MRIFNRRKPDWDSILESVFTRNHESDPGRLLLQMIDAVSVPATGMAPLILGVSALGKNGVRDTPQARTAACVIAVAMARRLVLALAENDPAVDPTSPSRDGATAIAAVFGGCSLSGLGIGFCATNCGATAGRQYVRNRTWLTNW